MKRLLCLLIAVVSFQLAFAQEKPEGLFINSKAFDFKAKDQDGKEVSLKDLRKKGPVVVVFYRGYWCPYCNKALKRFQDSLQLITDKGAQFVAITPEGEEFVDSTVARTGARYPILSDADMSIAKKYGVAFKVDDRTIGRYKNAGIDLLKVNSQKEAYLPVPALYIINRDGAVTYRYFNEDYRKRISVKEILDNLIVK